MVNFTLIYTVLKKAIITTLSGIVFVFYVFIVCRTVVTLHAREHLM